MQIISHTILIKTELVPHFCVHEHASNLSTLLICLFAELCSAATKIQASFRGHMSRKEQAGGSVGKAVDDFVENAAAKIEEKVSTAHATYVHTNYRHT